MTKSQKQKASNSEVQQEYRDWKTRADLTTVTLELDRLTYDRMVDFCTKLGYDPKARWGRNKTYSQVVTYLIRKALDIKPNPSAKESQDLFREYQLVKGLMRKTESKDGLRAREVARYMTQKRYPRPLALTGKVTGNRSEWSVQDVNFVKKKENIKPYFTKWDRLEKRATNRKSSSKRRS